MPHPRGDLFVEAGVLDGHSRLVGDGLAKGHFVGREGRLIASAVQADGPDDPLFDHDGQSQAGFGNSVPSV